MGNDHPNFLSTDFPRTLVVFGHGGNPETIFKNVNLPTRDFSYELSGNYALLHPSSPGLRFNSSGWITIAPQKILNVSSTEDLFLICKDRIINRTNQFSGHIRLFLQRYFQFLHSQLYTFQNELEPEKNEEEIFSYKDWIFSAWLPLPQANILLPPDYKGNEPCFAEVDLAFWIDGRLIVVMIDNAVTLIASQKKKLDYLVEKHPSLTVISLPGDKLEEEEISTNVLPEPFTQFWRKVPLPRGPCIPEHLISIGETNDDN